MAARPDSGFLRRRPLFWLALMFCAGIALDAFVPLPLTTLFYLVAASFMLAIASVGYVHRSTIPAGLLSACVLGALTHAAQFRVVPADDISVQTPERPNFMWVRGTITESEWRVARSPGNAAPRIAWTLALNSLGREPNTMQPASGRIRVSLKAIARVDDTPTDDEKSDDAESVSGHLEALAEGDRIECRVLLEPLPVSTIPDGFDYGAYLAGLGVRRVGTVSSSTVHKLAGPEWWRFALLLRRLSGHLAAQTNTLLNGHTEQAGLLNAMVFGRRESLSVSDREAFAISGTAHLLAISGLHIQLVCVLMWRSLGLFGISKRKSAVAVLVACFAYCLLTGSSPPAVRATAMFGTYVAASFFQRESEPLSALGAAALIVLSYAPHDLFTAGFQLSFLAVLSLFTLRPLFQETWEKWYAAHTRPLLLAPGETPPLIERVKQWAAESMLITLSAWLATSPSVAWHMGRFSTLGLFVNLFALPFLTVCMAFGSATIAFGALWPTLGKVLGWGAYLSLSLLESINAFCAAVPGSSIDMPRPYVATLVLYALVMLSMWVTPPPSAMWRRVLGLTVACPLLLVSTILFCTPPASPELTIFDLQTGRAALIESKNGSAMIDTGGPGQGLRIAELLRRRRIQRLDVLVITSDSPGAISGALDIVPRVAPRRVILPRCKFPSEIRRKLEAVLTEKNITYGSPVANETVESPIGIRWEFADDGPPADKPAANTTTLSVRVQCGAFNALFVEAKSSASLQRLLPKIGESWSADVLRIIPGEFGRWPRETTDLIRLSRSTILVAGTTTRPDESSGVDFDALEARVIAPHTEGSIRIRRETSGRIDIQSFRGEWSSTPK
ncbi:MAG: ComEC/Rec2 family competence protein [Planctomycetota bacterium]